MRFYHAFLSLLALGNIQAQPIYLETPTIGFVGQQDSAFNAGNGVYMPPGGSALYAITSDCIVTAYDPNSSGSPDGLWTMMTNGILSDSSVCNGGIAFNMAVDSPYLVYMADDTNAGTRVIALDLETGENVWTSETIVDENGNAATSAGTPAVSEDGNFVGVTVNSGSIIANQLNTGHFALIDTKVAPSADTGLVPILFTQSDAAGIYSPIGVVTPRDVNVLSQPQLIYRDQQRFNRQPVFIWSYDTVQAFDGSATTAGDPGLWGFQLPAAYDAGAGPDSVGNSTIINMGNSTEQTSTAATFTTNPSFPVNMYLNGVRNDMRGYTSGQRLDAARTSSLGLERGAPRYLGGQASMILSDPTAETPIAFGPGAPGATQEFIATPFTDPNSTGDAVFDSYAVGADVIGRAVTDGEARVYVADVEGNVHALNFDMSLEMVLTAASISAGSIIGDLAISTDGSRIFVPSNFGNGVPGGSVIAIDVAESTSTGTPTMAPVTGMPTAMTDAPAPGGVVPPGGGMTEMPDDTNSTDIPTASPDEMPSEDGSGDDSSAFVHSLAVSAIVLIVAMLA